MRRALIVAFGFSLIPCLACAQSSREPLYSYQPAYKLDTRPLDYDYSNDQVLAREGAMESQMRDFAIDVTLQYCQAHGTQSFEMGDDSTGRERLKFPRSGPLLTLAADVRYLRFGLMGSYSSSAFKKTTATETEGPWDVSPEVQFESESKCSAKTEQWDANVYYRIFGFENNAGDAAGNAIYEFFKNDLFPIDQFGFDVFGGYQREVGRYHLTEGVTTVDSWAQVSEPFDGLDSFFKMSYRGPRFGLRAQGAKGPVSSRLSCAYAWLQSEGFGWENLSDRQFWLKEGGGNGLNANVDIDYRLTGNLSCGVGYVYSYMCSNDGRFIIRDNGVNWYDEATWKKSQSQLQGFTFLLRYSF